MSVQQLMARADRRIVAAVVLALISGIVSSFIYKGDGGLREASVGIAFAAAFGWWLVALRLAGLVRSFAFAVAAVAIWEIAHGVAIDLFDTLPGGADTSLASWQGLVTGLAAGFVGVVGLDAAAAILIKSPRTLSSRATTIMVGAACGGLLAVAAVFESMLVLFPPWQAAVAGFMAAGLIRGAGNGR
jgi:hypothetical protein